MSTGCGLQFLMAGRESKMRVPFMGVPLNGWFIMDSTIKMDDLGFRCSPISGKLHLVVSQNQANQNKSK